MPFIIDAHEDIAYASLNYKRDYRLSAHEIRRREHGTETEKINGQALLGWPDYQRGQVAIVFATLFLAPEKYKGGEQNGFYFSTCEQAYRLNHQQLDFYRSLTESQPDEFRLICTSHELVDHLALWENRPADYPKTTNPVGLVILMEGAEGICDLGELEEWWEAGVRIIGPVWAGTRFCGGSYENGKFTREGYALLEAMADLGFALDLSHMNEVSTLTALDTYQGVIVATHANARARIKVGSGDRYPTDGNGERHLSDLAIRRLVERDGVMGLLPYNRFLVTDWTPEKGRHTVKLEMLAGHVDHICQIAGDARHVGIGTDFDGGFGYPAVPEEIDTVADLQKLAGLLENHGYSMENIAAILGGNWRRILERTLPGA